MLAGVRLAGSWHHSRAHRLFAAARWSADALGLGMLEVIVACLLRPDAPLRLVILAAQYLPGSLVEPTTAEILAVQRAWAAAAA